MSQNDSSKFSSFLVLFLMFDLAGLIAVILLFTLYCNKAKKLEKLSQSERGGTTPNSSNYVSESGTAVVEISDRRNIEDKLQVGYPTAPPPMRFGGGGEEEKLVFLQGSETALFGLNELLKASAEGMGKGNIGNTYKAKMMEGKIVVVAKRLRDLRPLSMEDLKKQLLFLGGLRHPNLLTPLAYYVSRDEKLLVSMFQDRFSVTVRLRSETSRLGSAKKPSKIGSFAGPMFDRISVSVHKTLPTDEGSGRRPSVRTKSRSMKQKTTVGEMENKTNGRRKKRLTVV
ncbi:Pollen receptor-like kinase 3 [Linum perenne]